MESRFHRKTVDLLVEKRKELGLSQEYVAEQLVRDQSFLSKIETGTQRLSLFDFYRLAKLLGLSKSDVSHLLATAWEEASEK